VRECSKGNPDTGHDCWVKGDDSATAVLRALALVQRQLLHRQTALAGLGGNETFVSPYHHLELLEVRNTPEQVAAIAAGFCPGREIWTVLGMQQRVDNRDVEWSCDAHNALDGSGWLGNSPKHFPI
jgi:hypothetical protein